MESVHAILHFSGEARNNQGPAGAGYIIQETDGGEIIYKDSISLGTKTKNEAGYEAFIRGVERVYKEGYTYAIIKGDSPLVCNQVSGKWKIKAQNLKPYYDRAVAIVGKIRNKIELISEVNNRDAHSLASEAVSKFSKCAPPNSDEGRIEIAFRKWEVDGRPILVYGETQTGKKTAIRKFLKGRGYSICEDASAIEKHKPTTKSKGSIRKSKLKSQDYIINDKPKKLIPMRQTTLTAKLSYLIHEQDIKWSKTEKSPHYPMFMSCIDPYKHLRKTELEKKFNLVRWGLKNRNVGSRDISLNYWDATRALCRKDLGLDSKLKACTMANSYLSTVIHNSYLKATNSIDTCAIISDMYSQNDMFVSLEGEYEDILTKIGPASLSNVSRTQLQIQSYHPPQKKRKRSKSEQIMDQIVPRVKHIKTHNLKKNLKNFF